MEELQKMLLDTIGSKDKYEASFARLIATGSIEKILDWVDAEKQLDEGFAVSSYNLAKLAAYLAGTHVLQIIPGKEKLFITMYTNLISDLLIGLAKARAADKST